MYVRLADSYKHNYVCSKLYLTIRRESRLVLQLSHGFHSHRSICYHHLELKRYIYYDGKLLLFIAQLEAMSRMLKAVNRAAN